MQMTEQLKKTSLYDIHVKLGAKMAEFGGFLMPIQYTNITEEHLVTRNAAGLFDLSHMGEFLIEGKGAEAFLSRIVTGDPRSTSDGKTLYTLFCNEKGGVVDDIIIYRMSRDRFMLVVNASNIQKDDEWIASHLDEDVRFENLSDTIALLALQGPFAEPILRKTPFHEGSDLKRNSLVEFEVKGERILISRTGYTGEDGFEIYGSPQFSLEVWEILTQAGRSFGLKPVGLGARDTLRIEARLPLYGHDLDDETTPFEAGLGWTITLQKDFIGKEALTRQKAEGVKRKWVGFEMLEQGIPRQGCVIWKDRPVGRVTSGTYSPSFKKNIGLGYVIPEVSRIGTEFFIEIRDRKLRARVVETPFYRMKPKLTER